MSLASCSGTGMSSANNEAHHPTITANENRNNTTRNASSIVATTSNSSTANTTAHTATNEERDGITPVRRHRSSNTGMLENRKFWLEPFRITNQTTATQPPFISTTATTTNETAPSSSSSPPPPPDQESISDPNKNHVLHQYVTSSHRTPPTTKTLIRRNPQTVFHALTDWIEAWTALCHSEELHALHFTTVQLVGTTGNVLWQTAIFLPVTVPTRIAKRTQRIVRWIWEGMMLRSKPQPRQLTAMGETTSTQGLSSINHETRGNKDSSTLTEQQSEQLQQLNHSNAGPLQLIFTVVTLPHRVALQAAESITREAGEIVRKVIQIDRPRTLQANRGDTKYLDRLRLDYSDGEGSLSCFLQDDDYDDEDVNFIFSGSNHSTYPLDVTPPRTSRNGIVTAKATAANEQSTTHLILVVKDLGVLANDGQTPVSCIDLEQFTTTRPKNIHGRDGDTGDLHCDDEPLKNVLNQLVITGLSFLELSIDPVPHPTRISWRAEGSTGKSLRQLRRIGTDTERVQILQRETLIWSGQHPEYAVPFFFARGIVPYSSRDMVNLLWDNERTFEYNKFCLGRRTLHNLSHDPDRLLQSAEERVWGTKVIQSETRVPFTGFSVHMKCLMHTRPLNDGTGDYLIVSRSLRTGTVGGTKELPPANGNEIIWGINVMKSVPDHPHLTELLSLSQVQSSAVPQFLAQRIAIMGSEDFFRNVRSSKK